MKGRELRDLFKQTGTKVSAAVLAMVIAAGSIFAANYQTTTVPELVTFVDTDEVVLVDEEEVPLAAPKVTTASKTKKTSKKIVMRAAAKKTYTSKSRVVTKTSSKTTRTSAATTTTKTTVSAQVANAYKKKSRICTQTTTVKTTVTKTVLAKTTAAKTTSTAKTTATGTTIAALAPKVNSRVTYAWNKLGFKFVINPKVSYSGLFSARNQNITLKSSSGTTVYHELGHFVAFVAGNVDTSASFKNVYNAEKSRYTAYNKAYVTQNSSEYFAESFKEYTLTPAALKAARPQTYAAIQNAVNKLTVAQVSRVATVYAAVWK